jgi:NitT/TauT family transport system ATP-binding protein
MESVITLHDLGLTFERDGSRTEVLKGLDLDIVKGEFLALVGASGVGKSTLLRVIMALSSASEGRVEVKAGGDPLRRACAMVFQDARLLPWRRVLANVAFGLEKLSLSRTDRHERAHQALEFVGLGTLATRYPHELSGGQRQRVALARALAVDPDILLMDEPFSALDALTRETLQDELIRVWQETGKTVVFVTHDIEEAAYLADRVIVLAGSPGRVMAEQQITAQRPRRRSDQSLTNSVNLLRRDLGADLVSDGGGV